MSRFRWYFSGIGKFAKDNVLSTKEVDKLFEQLQQIRNLKKITKDTKELRKLKVMYDEIRMTIIRGNEKLIDWCIEKLIGNVSYMRSDLRMYGMEALVQSIEQYDYTKYSDFYMYASAAIEYKLRRIFGDLYGISWMDYCAKYVDSDISTDNDITNQDYCDINSDCMPITQDDYSEIDEYEDELYRLFIDFDSPEEIAINNVARQSLKKEIMELIATLDEREQFIIIQRFGLIDGKEKTLQSIGTELNVTKEAVRLKVATILKKLRRTKRAIELGVYIDYEEPKIVESDGNVNYERLIQLLELELKEDTILTFLNMDGIKWDIKKLECEINKVNDILNDILELHANGVGLRSIENEIHQKYQIKFTRDFLNKLISKYKKHNQEGESKQKKLFN